LESQKHVNVRWAEEQYRLLYASQSFSDDSVAEYRVASPQRLRAVKFLDGTTWMPFTSWPMIAGSVSHICCP